MLSLEESVYIGSGNILTLPLVHQEDQYMLTWMAHRYVRILTISTNLGFILVEVYIEIHEPIFHLIRQI